MLPVIWATAATVIALVLYRSSAAFFEHTRRKEGETRRIRLVGSVCIATIAFIGFWKATPSSLQTGLPDDARAVRLVDIHNVTEALEQTNAALDSLFGCSALTPLSQCKSELEILRSRMADALGQLRRMTH
jgi:hypothetical protein